MPFRFESHYRTAGPGPEAGVLFPAILRRARSKAPLGGQTTQDKIVP
jgi:hypothetical protein